MNGPITKLDGDITISVERMMRFCYLTQMLIEYMPYETTLLPVHLSRFGTMLLETSSFLYSLFDPDKGSINLLKIWQGFDHPFGDELQEFARSLKPFENDLRLVRNRVGFHGSISRSKESAGFSIFDVNSSRAKGFAKLVRRMQLLSLKMIKWYIERMDETAHPTEIWQEFEAELLRHPLLKHKKK